MESRIMLHQNRYANAAVDISPADAAYVSSRPGDRELAVAPGSKKPNLVFLDLCLSGQRQPAFIRKLYPENIFGDAPVAIIASDTQRNVANTPQAMRFLGYYYDFSQHRVSSVFGAQRFTIESRGFYEKLLLQQFKEILLASHQLSHYLASATASTRYLQGLLLFDKKQKNEYHFPMLQDDLDPAQELLVELVEFCPSCLQYDIRLNYACPTCRSLNLKSTVNVDTMSRYFQCQHCGRQLAQPPLRGRCRQCNKQFPSEKVLVSKLYRYEVKDGKLMIAANDAPVAAVTPPTIEEHPTKAVATTPSSTTAKTPPNYLPLAFKEARMSYIPPIQFQEQLGNEINLAAAKQEEITIMSVKLPHLPLLYALDDSKTMVRIYKAIIYYISDFLRFRDKMSFNLEQQQILVILPATPLKLAKIIARKIINQLYQFRQYFQVDIYLASFPQDGRTAAEILTILDLGLEKVQFDTAL